MNPTNKACIFVRVSSDQQDYKRQIDDLTKYANGKNLKIVGVIAEKISGAKKNEERPGIVELRQRAAKKEFSKVLISELSRLGRNAYQVATIIKEFTELGISIVVQSLGIETISENGKANPMIDMLIAIINQFSQMERSFLIDRVKSGVNRAKAAGKHCGRPKGAKMPNDKFIEKYRKAFSDLTAGISIRKVARIHQISASTCQRLKMLQGI